MSYKLRDYQVECIDVIKKADLGERLLISLPTGSGKTVIFASVASEVTGRTLIIVPSTELREQSIEKMKVIDPDIDVGSVQGALNQISNKVICATRQSLTHSKSNRIEKMLEHGQFELIIFDEVHQACDQVIKIINKIKNRKVKIIGMTATPWNKTLSKIFKEINYSKTILDMILDGYLCEPKALMVESKTSLIGVNSVAGEFNQKELEEKVDNPVRNRLIVKAYQEYAHERKSTLVFCVGLQHLHNVVEEFNSEGIYCKGLDSNNSKEERAALIAEFKSGKLPVLINCGVLTTGFDHESIDCIILARPTKSKILYCQILGRGLRIADGKEDCLIIDINDIVKTHDLMNIGNIFDIKIKHGETVRKAIYRSEKEKKDEETRKKEEEERRVEREKLKQQEMKLRAEKIKLFNRDMTNRFNESKLDWFKANNVTYALTVSMTGHYTIENVNDTYFLFYVSTNKENKYAEFKQVSENLTELIKYVEKEIGKNSFTDKNSDWKRHDASDKQKQFANFAKTKWDAHIFFSSNTINSILKKWKSENANNNEEAVV